MKVRTPSEVRLPLALYPPAVAIAASRLSASWVKLVVVVGWPDQVKAELPWVAEVVWPEGL